MVRKQQLKATITSQQEQTPPKNADPKMSYTAGVAASFAHFERHRDGNKLWTLFTFRLVKNLLFEKQSTKYINLRHLLMAIFCDIFRPLARLARHKSQRHGRAGNAVTNANNEPKLISAMELPTLFLIVCAALSLLTRRILILCYGLAAVGSLYLSLFSFLWIIYTIDNPQLIQTYLFCRNWVQLALREGEQALSQPSTNRYIVAAAVVSSAPTGMMYFKWVLRENQRRLNEDFLIRLNERNDSYATRQEPQRLSVSLQRMSISRSANANSLRKGTQRFTSEVKELAPQHFGASENFLVEQWKQ